MNVFIAGASGFIGQALVKHYRKQAHCITVVGRDRQKLKRIFGEHCHCLSWDHVTAEQLAAQNLVINLAGSNIADARWQPKRKQQLLASRLDTTKLLAKHCATLGNQAPALFNASAIGIYGLQTADESGDQQAADENTELQKNHDDDFLATIADQWEAALKPAEQAGVRVVKLRLGVVLDPGGGLLAKLQPTFRLGLGCVLGNGKQMISWIALRDVIKAIDFIYRNQAMQGAINLVAPTAVSQRQFARSLAQVNQRPLWLTLPRFIIKQCWGEMGESLLLGGQHVKPSRLLQAGFQFDLPELSLALQQLRQVR